MSRGDEHHGKGARDASGGDREGVVNTNAGGGQVVDGVAADGGAVREMEVVRPSEVAVRAEASNHPHLHWLKTVVESVVGKGAAGPRQVQAGKMGDERKFSVVDVSKWS